MGFGSSSSWVSETRPPLSGGYAISPGLLFPFPCTASLSRLEGVGLFGLSLSWCEFEPSSGFLFGVGR